MTARLTLILLALLLAGCAGATPQTIVTTAPPAVTVTVTAPADSAPAPAAPTPQTVRETVTVTAVVTVTPTPTPAPETERFEFEGKRSKKTEAFLLAGGDYVVEWTAEGTTCYHSARLDRAGGTEYFFPEDVADGGVVEGSVEDRTNLYDVEPGRYFFDVNSGCDWTLAIESA